MSKLRITLTAIKEYEAFSSDQFRTEEMIAVCADPWPFLTDKQTKITVRVEEDPGTPQEKTLTTNLRRT